MNNGKVSLQSKASIGLGQLAMNMLAGIITGYLVYFATNMLGVSALAVGNVMLISRILDGISDLGFGVILGKTQTKWGKARPWILWSCVPFSLFSILIFMIPGQWSTTGKIIGLFVGYNLYALAMTALLISFNTLTVLLTDDEKEQISITSFIMFFGPLGNVIINAVAVGALTKLSGTSDGSFTQGGFIKLTAILAVVSALGSILTFLFTKEQHVETEKNTVQKENSMAQIKELFHNKYWLMQTGVEFAHFMGLFCRLTALIYFTQYVMQDLAVTAVVVMADQVPGLLAMPVTAKLCGKYGKRNCALVGIGASLIGLILMILNIHNFPLFVAGLIIHSILYSPYNCTTNAFIADTVNYSQWKNGVSVEAMAFSITSFCSKIGSGLSGSLVGYVMAATGYDAAQAVQSAGAQKGITFIYVGVTIIATIIQVLLLLVYDLDKKMPQIREDLQAAQNSNNM